MTPVSAVIITFNEERNIARCIDSLKGIANEIVVLDSFSKDKTEEICRNLGVKFFQHAFDGHIQQKNRAIKYATYPHVLSLDADEALSDELKKSILDVKNNFSRDGYSMNRMTNYCGKWIKHSGWYPDRKLRLWNSQKGEWRGINPHDKYELFEGGNEGFLKGDLLHYSYYSIEQHREQIEKFSTIAAKALYGMNKKSTLLHLIIKPVAKFIRNYFLKLGFLDGASGWTICRLTAKETYMKYAKLRKLNKDK
ncbi:MAG: glycosyltransferase family 2 protein [Bacteroidota bacterium]